MVYPHTVCGWVHDPGGLYKELDFPWLYPVNPGTLRKYISTYVLIVVTIISSVLLYIAFLHITIVVVVRKKVFPTNKAKEKQDRTQHNTA